MNFPPFRLLRWLEHYWKAGAVDVCTSNIEGYRFSEFGRQFDDMNLAVAYPFGEPSLRETLAKEYGVKSENVMVTVGASEANFLICMALYDKGERFIVENPAYEPLAEIPRGLGYGVDVLERRYEDGFRFDTAGLVELMKKGAKYAFICNPHNPTGIEMSEDDLRRIAEAAEEHDAYVLVDEIFKDVMKDPPPSAISISDRMIVTASISKVFSMAGLRLGWIVANSELMEKFESLREYTTVAVSSASEEMAKWAFERKDEILERARSYVNTNRPIVDAWLESSDLVEYNAESKTHFCFPRLNGIDDLEFGRTAAEKYNTIVGPGRFFGLPGHFRLGFGMNTEALQEGLANLTKALKDF
ncbi:MAG: aminotransferase class I/II-fold pyridoxal phosphate-dependent enzyme [Thermoplasmata archaeon]|nr:aminotransferase class I/II-fold pyridoxal phosphate-dependent enzyme [Thermoplasmata archaeon]